ncbi:hypothetical protein CLV92_10571 [Kineococcus xinjiangensis]|uniref:Transcriptional regulator with AbiEi antitoxin domain of type IV toxin-antitoxin system n=1 Tax=Kineococcus xinjiangensis TaxID=512762 RepID=A0A2S6INY4_9ACTN|nr:hypothetical protein [Kineococcus xinjiangensis]PPK95972.1 hypothetical protein CLV92_10571 [Kineococcus xinjiangensis]
MVPHELSSRLSAYAAPDVALPWLPPAAEAAEAHRWVQLGLLQVVVGRVVVAADVEVDLPVRARALRLLVPPGCVVLGSAAAWLHVGGRAVLPLPLARPGGPARIPRRGRGGTVSMSAAVPPPEDVLDVHGVQVTTPARTAVDVARSCEAGPATALVRRLLDLGLEAAAVEEQLQAMRGSRNVRSARAVLDAAGALR